MAYNYRPRPGPGHGPQGPGGGPYSGGPPPPPGGHYRPPYGAHPRPPPSYNNSLPNMQGSMSSLPDYGTGRQSPYSEMGTGPGQHSRVKSINGDDIVAEYYQQESTNMNHTVPNVPSGVRPGGPGAMRPRPPISESMEMRALHSTAPGPPNYRPAPSGYGHPPRQGPGPMMMGGPRPPLPVDLYDRRPSDTSTIFPSDSVSQYGQAPPMTYRPPPVPNNRFGPPPAFQQDDRFSGSDPNIAVLEKPLPPGVSLSSNQSPGPILSNSLPPGVTTSTAGPQLSVDVSQANKAYPGGIPPSPPPPPIPYDKSPERYEAYQNSRGCCSCCNCCCCTGCCVGCCLPPFVIFLILALLLGGLAVGIYFLWPTIMSWVHGGK